MTKRRMVTTLVVGCDDGEVKTYFGVEYGGALWLVTSWLIETASGYATPERMIRVEITQEIPPGDRFDYVVRPLPKAVIEGFSQDTPGYEVRSLPDEPKVHRSELYQLPSMFP